jgi:hypothetical protein
MVQKFPLPRRITLSLAGLILVSLLPVAAYAGPADCYRIKDPDKRAYCLATAKGQQSRCHSIKDRDSRNLCLAEVGQQKSRCHSIKDKDNRSACLAKF